jgi:hypothetical protein
VPTVLVQLVVAVVEDRVVATVVQIQVEQAGLADYTAVAPEHQQLVVVRWPAEVPEHWHMPIT